MSRDDASSANPSAPGRQKKLAYFAWVVLAYNVAVILWGAFVRASGSGAGCGRHWPLCNGEVVPQPKSIATVIEATHRVTSGLAVALVLSLLVATLVGLERGHPARRGAVFSTAFIFGEAILGAGLVLFELVAHDTSMKRALSMILHLSNTFFLLGALALTAWWITTNAPLRSRWEPSPGSQTLGRSEKANKEEKADASSPSSTSSVNETRDNNPGKSKSAKSPLLVRVVVVLSLGSVLLLGASGAIAALGDTLFPVTSLREGFAQDLSPMAHVFLRLRLLHPMIALGASVLVLGAAGVVRGLTTAPRARALSRVVTMLFVTQFAVGLLNLSLLAPVGMQLLHLLLADATWIALVLMGWEAWRGARSEERSAAPSSALTAS